MDAKFLMSTDEAIAILNVLDEVVVSLDRIGSREADGDDPGHEKVWRYLTVDGATRRLSRARARLTEALTTAYGDDELDRLYTLNPVKYWPDTAPEEPRDV